MKEPVSNTGIGASSIQREPLLVITRGKTQLVFRERTLNATRDLPFFVGDEASEWVNHAEGLFRRFKILEEEWVAAVSLLVEGRAEIWYRLWKFTTDNQEWERFKQDLCERFQPLPRVSFSVVLPLKQESMENQKEKGLSAVKVDEDYPRKIEGIDQDRKEDEVKKETSGHDIHHKGQVVGSGKFGKTEEGLRETSLGRAMVGQWRNRKPPESNLHLKAIGALGIRKSGEREEIVRWPQACALLEQREKWYPMTTKHWISTGTVKPQSPPDTNLHVCAPAKPQLESPKSSSVAAHMGSILSASAEQGWKYPAMLPLAEEEDTSETVAREWHAEASSATPSYPTCIVLGANGGRGTRGIVHCLGSCWAQLGRAQMAMRSAQVLFNQKDPFYYVSYAPMSSQAQFNMMGYLHSGPCTPCFMGVVTGVSSEGIFSYILQTDTRGKAADYGSLQFCVVRIDVGQRKSPGSSCAPSITWSLSFKQWDPGGLSFSCYIFVSSQHFTLRTR